MFRGEMQQSTPDPELRPDRILQALEAGQRIDEVTLRRVIRELNFRTREPIATH